MSAAPAPPNSEENTVTVGVTPIANNGMYGNAGTGGNGDHARWLSMVTSSQWLPHGTHSRPSMNARARSSWTSC